MLVALLQVAAMVAGPAPAVAAPTVGDTVWLARRVVTDARREVRAADWHPESPLQLLGPPQVRRRGDTLEVRYPVAFWAPGSFTVEVPGPVLLTDGVATDSLPPLPEQVTVASVLPRASRTTVAPHGALPLLERQEQTPRPLLIGLAAAAILTAVLAAIWRRPPRALPAPPPAPAVELPLARWLDAGEVRLVAAALGEEAWAPSDPALVARLRDRLERPRDRA